MKLRIVFFVFLPFFCLSQLKDTLYGPIKSIKEEVIFVNKQKQNYKLFSIDGDYGHSGFISNESTKYRFYNNWYFTPFTHYINYYQEFDSVKNPSLEIWYDKSGNEERRYEYIYDYKINKLIQKKDINLNYESTIVNKFSYNFKGKIKSEITYHLDSSNFYKYKYFNYQDSLCNLVSSVKSFGIDGISSSVRYVYNHKGLKIKKFSDDYYNAKWINQKSYSEIKSDEGIEKLREEYFYDNNKRLIQTNFYKDVSEFNYEVKLESKEKLIYNNENLIYKILTDQNDTIQSINEYVYDILNRKISERKYYFFVIESSKKTKTFNKKKIIFIDSKYSKRDYFLSSEIIFYYDKKKLVKTYFYDSYFKTPSISKFEYVFDHYGNWVEQIKFVNNEKLYLWKRSIKYDIDNLEFFLKQ